MLHLTIYSASTTTESIMQILRDEPAVSAVALLPGESVQPPGDLVLADVAREAANNVIDQLCTAGVHVEGSLHIEPVQTWISRPCKRGSEVRVGRTRSRAVPQVVSGQVPARRASTGCMRAARMAG